MAVGESPTAVRSEVAPRATSQSEESLDLAPNGQDEQQREREQEDDDDEKTDVGVAAVALVVEACLALGTLTPECPRNRERIDLRRVVGCERLPRGFGHARRIIPQTRGVAPRSPRPERARRHTLWRTLMVVQPSQQERAPGAVDAEALPERAFEALARSSRRLAECSSLREAVQVIVSAAAEATGAAVAVGRLYEPEGGWLIARAVVADSPAVAAELEGSRFAAGELPRQEISEPEALPVAVRRIATAGRMQAVLQIPVWAGQRPVASLELLRAGSPFHAGERLLGRIAGDQLQTAARAFGEGGSAPATREPGPPTVRSTLELAGDALAAGAGEGDVFAEIARLAAEGTGALACVLWRAADRLDPAASHGARIADSELDGLREHVAHALAELDPVTCDHAPGRFPAGASLSVTVRLGDPPLGGLQLLYLAGAAPAEPDLASLATFGIRAAHALRATDDTRQLSLELERAQTLVTVVAQAIAELSLAHTLETAVDRVGELLGVERVAIYLREGFELRAAASRGLSGPHARLAECLLELALGPARARGLVLVEDAVHDRRLRASREAAAESGIEAALGVPLAVADEVIGLLAVYPARGRTLTENESALVIGLAAQLAVAVENARLHEQAKRLGAELEEVLASERKAARQLRTLYEISRSFAQSLSLETTLYTLARSVVESFELDAAVIRMPDTRRESLVTRAAHVADPALEQVVRTILSRSQSMASPAVQRLLESREPVLLDPDQARGLDTSHSLLAPFLEKGSTAAIVPIARSGEVLATLTLLSLDAARPITEETVGTARTIAGQAGLALANARLLEQQQNFVDTMQRSLRPRSEPRLQGLELGTVYQSSGRMDVGGDVCDYLVLPDGRLAVVLGDVTGHGIEAAADMAMAKFVFRSLARQHPDPGHFLTFANEIVLGEIPVGKFITMASVTVDRRSGRVSCASAGHPLPRLVRADGSVLALGEVGLPLGVESGQIYPEVREALPPESSLVLYTDGVIEARRDGELYGVERLDSLLVAERALPAQALAERIVAECRGFAGGELSDDCAVVVVRRLGE